MPVSINHWRAAVGQWHDYQYKYPLDYKPTRSFYQFHMWFCKHCFILLTSLLVFLLLSCGDIHQNPGPTTSKSIPLSFCHLNVRSITHIDSDGFVHIDHIEQTLTVDKHCDLIAMTETHLSSEILDHEIAIPGYQLFRKDRNRHGGGVCIYVHDNIAASVVSHLLIQNVELLWLKLVINNQSIFFGVCYRPPGQTYAESKNS